MTFLEKYKRSKTWQERALVINLFYHIMSAKRKDAPRGKRWSVKLTAQYFGISTGTVSEDMKLASNMKIIEEYKTRKAALMELK